MLASMLLLALACRSDNEIKELLDTSPPGDDCEPALWYLDTDGDGWGGDEVEACEAPPDTVDLSGDCDDSDPLVHPEGVETCDDRDEDCDLDVDEGLDQTWWTDADQDGFGDPEAPQVDCAQPSGTTDNDEDCDDDDAAIHPAAAELCNGYDDDCDGLIDQQDDDLDPSSLGTWYLDDDQDGYGTAAVEACEQPAGTVDNDDDCDDTDAAIYPGASIDLTVRACVDGSDWINVQGDQLWWEHRNHTTVGLHPGCSFSETLVDGVAWTPSWTGTTSSSFTVTELPAVPQTATLSSLEGRGNETLTAQPDASNGYLLQALLDDDPQGGPGNYEVVLTYQTCL